MLLDYLDSSWIRIFHLFLKFFFSQYLSSWDSREFFSIFFNELIIIIYKIIEGISNNGYVYLCNDWKLQSIHSRSINTIINPAKYFEDGIKDFFVNTFPLYSFNSPCVISNIHDSILLTFIQ
jgi:hypothetical protein